MAHYQRVVFARFFRNLSVQFFAQVDQISLEVLKDIAKFVQVFVKTGNRFGFAEHYFVEVAKIGPTFLEGLFHYGWIFMFSG
jgi:hypothetical protein